MTNTQDGDCAKKLFRKNALQVVELLPIDAEFAKLICNAFRYIQFAAINQLYIMVGPNYLDLLERMKRHYPPMESIPRPGFTAGPCLIGAAHNNLGGVTSARANP